MNIIIDNELWCELKIKGSICKYKFLLSNIPLFLGGHKKTGDQLDNFEELNYRKPLPEVIEGFVLCNSNKNAKRCALSIRKLIESGYRNRYNGWFVGMELNDVFRHFDGNPMKFLHKSFVQSFSEKSLMQIRNKLKNSSTACYLFVCPEKDMRLDEIDVVYKKFQPDIDTDVIWQFYRPPICTRTVSIWYR
jgi:hypothetical protein